MIGRFGEDSSGGIIELDSNDLPLENNSKQAVLVRYGTSHIEYSNYNIIGYYSLDSNFRPLFNSGNIIQISENEISASLKGKTLVLNGIGFDISKLGKNIPQDLLKNKESILTFDCVFYIKYGFYTITF